MEVCMKRLGFVLVIAFLAIGAISAQNWGSRGITQSVTVEGTLQLQNGQIALSTGDAVYLVPVLNRYIGFIDGLNEGARVSVVGYVSGNVLQATQATINGKPYDFHTPGSGPRYANFGPGPGDACCSGWGSGGGMGRRW
jgi:hypothetical protein